MSLSGTIANKRSELVEVATAMLEERLNLIEGARKSVHFGIRLAILKTKRSCPFVPLTPKRITSLSVKCGISVLLTIFNEWMRK